MPWRSQNALRVPPMLPAADLWNQHDLTVRIQRRRIGVLIDLAIDGDRHAVLDLLAKAGKALLQFHDEPAEIGRRHLKLRLAAGEPLARRARDDDSWHQSPFAVSSALRTFGGD